MIRTAGDAAHWIKPIRDMLTQEETGSALDAVTRARCPVLGDNSFNEPAPYVIVGPPGKPNGISGRLRCIQRWFI